MHKKKSGRYHFIDDHIQNMTSILNKNYQNLQKSKKKKPLVWTP